MDSKKIFIAHNTVAVLPKKTVDASRVGVLFIGTLYKQKNVDKLLTAFAACLRRTCGTLKLDIVGDGEERENLKALAQKLGIADLVCFHGEIYDENRLSGIFANSILCVSPDQAGLSVLKSMGYGVPFVTRSNAITGGEILNIQNGVTGILFKSDSELEEILVESIVAREKFLTMGRMAKDYYDKCATVDIMARGAMDAVWFALRKNSSKSPVF